MSSDIAEVGDPHSLCLLCFRSIVLDNNSLSSFKVNVIVIITQFCGIGQEASHSWILEIVKVPGIFENCTTTICSVQTNVKMVLLTFTFRFPTRQQHREPLDVALLPDAKATPLDKVDSFTRERQR